MYAADIPDTCSVKYGINEVLYTGNKIVEELDFSTEVGLTVLKNTAVITVEQTINSTEISA